jgi:hypothetical protein
MANSFSILDTWLFANRARIQHCTFWDTQLGKTNDTKEKYHQTYLSNFYIFQLPSWHNNCLQIYSNSVSNGWGDLHIPQWNWNHVNKHNCNMSQHMYRPLNATSVDTEVCGARLRCQQTTCRGEAKLQPVCLLKKKILERNGNVTVTDWTLHHGHKCSPIFRVPTKSLI